MSEGKRIHAIAGLPRSGSTVLANLLAQNPRFYCSGTSPLLDCLVTARWRHDDVNEFRAQPEAVRDAKRRNVTRGILQHWYDDVDKPVIFDKSRGWPNFIEIAEDALGHRLKIVCTVRDVRAVLASFEKLHRKQKHMMPTPAERSMPMKFLSQEGRCEVWLGEGGMVGMAMNSIRDALLRGFGKSNLYFLEYEKLVSNKREREIRDLYDWLGEEYFEHDFKNVQQVTAEDDYFHGMPGLHTIRPEISRKTSDEDEPEEGKKGAREILGSKLFMAYEPIARFWEKES